MGVRLFLRMIRAIRNIFWMFSACSLRIRWRMIKLNACCIKCIVQNFHDEVYKGAPYDKYKNILKKPEKGGRYGRVHTRSWRWHWTTEALPHPNLVPRFLQIHVQNTPKCWNLKRWPTWRCLGLRRKIFAEKKDWGERKEHEIKID